MNNNQYKEDKEMRGKDKTNNEADGKMVTAKYVNVLIDRLINKRQIDIGLAREEVEEINKR